MAADPRKRQKKLERRAAKRKSKHHDYVREQSAGLPQRLTAAAGSPVLHTFASEILWEQGLGQVLLSRQLAGGEVAFAIFLVDRYCLGVKDAMSGITSRYDYDNRILRKTRDAKGGARDLSPAAARKFVEQSVEYARKLGFSPHPDYDRAKLLFGAIDPSEAFEELEFGKDGKPLFIAGPFDTPQRCQHIIKTLERSCGSGGYHFVMPVGSNTEILDVDEVFEGMAQEAAT